MAEKRVARRTALRMAGVGALALIATTIPAIANAPDRRRPAGGSLPSLAPDAPWSDRWDAVVAAAEREGALALLTVAGQGYRALVERFQAEYPRIAVQHVIEGTINGWLQTVRRVEPAGARSFDIGLIHSARALSEGRAEQVWTPLRPLLFRPDVLDPNAWRGGADARFMDNAADLCFAWEYQVVHSYAINTDLVRPGEITTAADLLAPKWRGKILSLHPRGGTALLSAASVARTHGFDMLGKLLVDQRPVFDRTGSGGDITQSLVRGEYPIALGVRPKALNPLRDQGLGHSVSYLDLPDADFVATNLLFSVARAAHPAAAALFANWLLTKDAQSLLSAGLRTNSARLDVPPSEPDGIATPGRTYYEPERESNDPHAAATQRFVNSLPLAS